MPAQGWIRRTADELSRSPGGAIRFVRRDMDINAFGVQLFELGPGRQGFEHTEGRSGQEELYVGLEGEGTLLIEDEEVPFGADVFVSIASGVRRLPIAGDSTLRYLCVGGVAGRPYVPPERFR
ncbi:MAG TPA: hypothetical protein VGW75_12385 [Solirubrobacteraceae bacterium]|jgi:uncharacterized cupin superfamily protein|nr:hypothetical protein [Solirubrobacteraceae bacterium]